MLFLREESFFPDEAVRRGTSLLDELLFLALVFFTNSIPLLDEGVLTTPLGYVIPVEKKKSGRVVVLYKAD